MSLYERGFEGDSDQDENGGNRMNFTDENKEETHTSYDRDNSFNSDSYSNSVYGAPSSFGVNNENKPKRDRKPGGFGVKVMKAAVIAAVFGIVAGVTFQGSSYMTRKYTDKPKASVESNQISTGKGSLTSTATSSASTVNDVSDIVKNVMPAVVQVTNMSVTEYRSFFGTFSQPTQSAGSGIIISQDDDYIYIASNNHVVADNQSLTVTFVDDTAVSAEVVGTDEQTDLSVIRVKASDISAEAKAAIKVATLGSSDDLLVGEAAVVIGNALGYGQSVTAGIISALNREVSIETSNGVVTNKLIQTNAAVNPGNSGGALLNMKGEVIGIVSAKYTDTKVEGMGYAIPISPATSIIKALMNGETIDHSEASEGTEATGAYLGIYGMDVSSENSMAYSMPQGVYVTEAIDGQPAAQAGIQKGDIITKVNGKAITSMEEVKQMMQSLKAGDKIKVVVSKRSTGYEKTKTVEVTLADASQAPKRDSNENNGNNNGDNYNGSAEDFFNKFFGGR